MSNKTKAQPKQQPKQKQKEKQKQREKLDAKVVQQRKNVAKDMHFVPFPLVFTVLLCSGALAVLNYRDVFSTGKVIFGDADEAMLQFTKSMQWFDDSKGWKSSQGGFSAVRSVSTDQNDMGGFFVRKMAGAGGLAFQLQKLYPIVFQNDKTNWRDGHLLPVLTTSVIGNLAVAAYYIVELDDLKAAGAQDLSFMIVSALIIEVIIMAGYIITLLFNRNPVTKSQKLPDGKGPNSAVCKILTRTVTIVSGLMTVIAGRDFFFPGQELPFPPHDDIYLEWTGAFIHSPPPDSEEAEEHGLEAPLHISEKFISRLMALYFLIFCFQKFVSVYLIRVGKDNSGLIKCKTFWQPQTIANLLVLFIFRVFGPSANTASFDIRWHLMSIGYESFIMGLYAFTG